jgi:ubiquinone/menaquinone biosynthesis C-methylase UbiE
LNQKLAKELSSMVNKQQARIVDLACGVGFSTRALESAFPDAESIWGIDTSPQMLAMANFITKHMDDVKPLFGQVLGNMSHTYRVMKNKGYRLRKRTMHKVIHFARGNAEDTALPANSFDLVTIMYAFHECPERGRDRILQEAKRLLSPGGLLAVIDIATDYVPSEQMLKGEPYVQEYQKNINTQLVQLSGFDPATYQTIVPHHLGMWTLKRSVV